jgi:PAS domain S-box-containing protein
MDYEKEYLNLKEKHDLLECKMELIQRSVNSRTYTQGETFFTSCVRHLSRTIGADYTFIGKLKNNHTIETVKLFGEGKILENFTYDLADTPCYKVIGETVCYHAKNVTTSFPKDQLLIDMEIEGYLGVPLYDSKKNVNGILVSLFKDPIEDPKLSESILLIYASQAGAELEHQTNYKKIKEIQGELTQEKNNLLESNKTLQKKNKELHELKQELDQLTTRLFQSNEQLITSEQEAWVQSTRLSTLIDNLPNGILIETPDRHISSVNQKFCDLFEIEAAPETLKGADCKAAAEQLKPLFKHGDIFINEIEKIINDGIVVLSEEVELSDGRFFHRDFLPVDMGNNQIERMWVYRDVTDQKEAEQELMDEMDFTATALDAQEDTFFLFDLTTGIALRWNKSFEFISGYSHEEIVNLQAPDTYYSKEDMVKAKDFLQEVIKNGSGTIELDLITKTGKAIPTEYQVSIINNESGEPQYIISIGRDITERLIKEQEIRIKDRAFNSSGSPLTIANLSGNLEYGNTAFINLLGYKNKQEIIGKHIREFWYNKEESQEILSTVVEKSYWSGERQVLTKGKKTIDVNFQASLIKNDKGSPTHLLVVYEDISQRKREERINAARLRLIDYSSKHTVEELLQLFLDEAEKLTSSNIGFYCLPEEDQKSVSLHVWSTNSVKLLKETQTNEIQNIPLHLNLVTDCIQQQKPIIYNNQYSVTVEGNASGEIIQLNRTLVIPVIRAGKVIAVLSLGNKNNNYDDNDVRIIRDFENLTWETIVRKRAEEGLINERNKAKNILEGTNAGTWDWNIETGELNINDRWAEIMGYTQKELTPINTDTWINSIHPEDFITTDRSLKEHFKGKIDYYAVEFRQKHKNGHWVWVNSRGKVIEWTSEGKPLRMYGTHLDISEQKKTQEQLKLQEEHFRMMVENMPVLINAFDKEGNFIFWNKECEKVTGYKANEVIGHKDVINKLYPDQNYKYIKIDRFKDKWNKVKNLEIDLFNKRNQKKTIIWSNINKPAPLKNWNGWEVGIDITERKKAEIALRESEKRYRLLVEKGPSVFWITDKTGKKSYISPNIKKIYGYTPEEIYKYGNKLWLDRIHKDDIEDVLSGFNAAFEKNKPFNTTYRIKNKAGKWIWLHDKGEKYINNQGQELAYGVFTDITENKEAETKIKESEEKYRALFMSAGDGVFLVQNDTIIDCNKSTLKLFEGREKQIIGHYPWEFAPEYQENGQQSKTFASEKIYKTLNEGPQSFEFKHKRISSVLFDTDITLSCVDADKKIIVAIVRDITEKKIIQRELQKSKQRFTSFMNHSPFFSYIKDKTLQYIYSNKDILDLFHLSDTSKISATDLFNTDIARKLELADIRIINKENNIEILEYEVEIENNKRWLRDVKFPIQLDDNHVLVGGIAQDITEQKKLENKIQENITKFKTLADYTYDWEYWKDTENNFIYVSPSCERISGYSNKEFLADGSLFNTLVIYADKKRWKKHSSESAKQIPCEDPLEIRIQTKEGKVRWINHVCRPVYDHKGNHIGNRGTNRDITVQKLSQIALSESESKFKQLSSLTFEGILIHYNGYIQNVNKALLDMTKYNETDLIGQSITNILTGQYKKQLKNALKRNDPDPFEAELIKKNKNTLPVEIKIRSISNDQSNLSVTSIRDITEQKQMQQKILNTIIQTEEKERKRVAQDLHDGLGPVLSTIKLLTQTYINSDNVKFKNKIKTQLISGIDEALEQTSAISNNLSPHVLNDFGLRAALQQFIDKVTGLGKMEVDYYYDFSFNMSKDVEITLYRVAIELLNNTIKHAKASNCELRITGDENQIFLSFHDNGIGFDLNTQKEEKKGMGLFNITNRIKSLDGEFYFENLRTGGILFSFVLPAH